MEELQKDITKLAYQVTGADNHIKSRDSRIAQTPIKDGEWSGARGASKYTPTDLVSGEKTSGGIEIDNLLE